MTHRQLNVFKYTYCVYENLVSACAGTRFFYIVQAFKHTLMA